MAAVKIELKSSDDTIEKFATVKEASEAKNRELIDRYKKLKISVVKK